MSLQESNTRKPDISLSLRTVADDLVADGRLSPADSEQLSLKTRRKEQLSWNPLELIAEEMLDDQKTSGRSLDLESLTTWLAEKAKHKRASGICA